jgi:hypothetical protein
MIDAVHPEIAVPTTMVAKNISNAMMQFAMDEH